MKTKFGLVACASFFLVSVSAAQPAQAGVFDVFALIFGPGAENSGSHPGGNDECDEGVPLPTCP